MKEGDGEGARPARKKAAKKTSKKAAKKTVKKKAPKSRLTARERALFDDDA